MIETTKNMIKIGTFIFGAISSAPIYIADIITGANQI